MHEDSYLGSRGGEVVCRAFHELILIDRVRKFQEEESRRQPRLSTDVRLEVGVKNLHGNDEIICGRANWAIGYGRNKIDTGSVLLVVETKRSEEVAVGLPQLMVCMAAVLKSRRGRTDNGFFGMIADSGTFQFAFLDHTKKLFLSDFLKWSSQQSTILAYIDAVLLEGIGMAQNTTSGSTSIHGYPRSLKEKWKFGKDEGEGEGGEE